LASMTMVTLFFVCMLLLAWYLGVFQPQYYSPERCEMQQGFYCKDHRVVDLPGEGIDYFKFIFQNGRGKEMNIQRMTVKGVGEVEYLSCETELLNNGTGLRVENGNYININVNCGQNYFDGISEGKKKFDLIVQWYSDDDGPAFNRTIKGQLLEKVTRC
jgi:hypothetical protein